MHKGIIQRCFRIDAFHLHPCNKEDPNRNFEKSSFVIDTT
jgi:hypothetical protein